MKIVICDYCGKVLEKNEILVLFHPEQTFCETMKFNFMMCLGCYEKSGSSLGTKDFDFKTNSGKDYCCDLCGGKTKHKKHLFINKCYFCSVQEGNLNYEYVLRLIPNFFILFGRILLNLVVENFLLFCPDGILVFHTILPL